MEPSDAVRQLQDRRKRLLGFPIDPPPKQPKTSPKSSLFRLRDLRPFVVGDVVAIEPNESEEKLWRKTATNEAVQREWVAYIHRVEMLEDNTQQLFVLWLYHPENTTISTADYPVEKELFMSDHCNCNEPKLLSTDVTSRRTVDWFSRAFDTDKDFLVRQTYMPEEAHFITLQKAHFGCDCTKGDTGSVQNCRVGDSVYIKKTNAGRRILEPVVIHSVDHTNKEVTVRRLLRLKRDCPDTLGNTRKRGIAENELVWTRELIKVSAQRVERRCYIKFFSIEDVLSHNIPFPYNRGGAGDFWILSTQRTMTEDQPKIKPLAEAPISLIQGPNPTMKPSFEKLPGLGLFSGCGNLDRGLEEAGAVQFKTAVDYNAEAVHTLRANARYTDLKLWLGSVDDYLAAALSASDMEEFAVIAAGSPCPGFSTLQQDWLSKQSLKNASHVTTFCSFVDLYRPKWALLENVVNMACNRKGYEGERVLSQIVACLVALGYQVRQFIMSSWNYRGSQQRSRLIVSIAAPGLAPIIAPWHTHSHPDSAKSRSIGELLTGQKFGVHEEYPTPFAFVSAGEAIAELPNIGNGKVQTCIPFPDHRLHRPLNRDYQNIINRVPTHPPGQGLADALRLGLIPPDFPGVRKEIGKAFRRMTKDGLISTITTNPSPHDARGGAVVHWEQNRPLSIEEARRAQGIPPDEVIIGSLSEQIRMVGNAVDRHVAEPLGLSLRHAVETSPAEILNADKVSSDKDTGVMTDDTGHTIRLNMRITASSSRQPPETTLESKSGAVEPSDNEPSTSFSSARARSVAYVLIPVRQHARQLHSSINVASEQDHIALNSVHNPLGPAQDTHHKATAINPPTAGGVLTSDTIFERLSKSVSGFLRPTFSALSNHLPVRGKRAREEFDDVEERPHLPSEESSRSSLSKRARREEHLEQSGITPSNGIPTKLTKPGSRPHHLDPCFEKAPSRKTRHSGLPVQYVPQAWDKVPEKGLKKANEQGRRAYA